MKRRHTWRFALVLCVLLFSMGALSWTKSKPAVNPEAAAGQTEMGKIAGKVIDKDTGNPLPATNIVVAGTKQGAAADASGQFWILIETGTYDLQISRIGYQTVAIKGVEVKPEQTTQVNPLLKAAVIEVGMGEEIPPPPPPPSADSKDEFVFVAYDKPPVPIGGFKAIQQHLVYPEIARKAGIEGKVVVLIQISEKGKVVKTKIEESLGPNGCDEAAVNALKSVEWKPAMQRDLPVAVWVAVPVDFRLTSEKPGK